MDVFDEIADERRLMASLLSGFTPEQLASQSLCSEWTVRDVAAHLALPLEVSLPRFMVTILMCGGSFDRANVRVTRKLAQRPIDEIIELLRRKATSRFTPSWRRPGGSSYQLAGAWS